MEPALATLFEQVGQDDRNYEYEQNICQGQKLFHTMTLDMVRHALPACLRH